MKSILFALVAALMVSTAHARQYIQCSALNTDLYSVVNLPTEAGGTLFLTTGVEYDDRLLVNIAFDAENTTNTRVAYSVVNGPWEGSLSFDSTVLGNRSDSFIIEAILQGMPYQFSCFARIYQDEN